MSISRALLASIVFPLATGCATPYQKGAAWTFTGGFNEEEAPGDLTKISFSGNGFISIDTAEKYTLYRCAEFAKEHGASHFILYETLMHASLGKSSDKINIGHIGGKPLTSIYILLRNKGGPGTWQAETVLKNYHSIVHPKKRTGGDES